MKRQEAELELFDGVIRHVRVINRPEDAEGVGGGEGAVDADGGLEGGE